jgi:serine/threonine protein kinase
MEENSDQVYYQNYSFKLFDNIEFIGRGAFSSVVKARHKESGWYYAIKLCDLGAKADPAKCIENLNREIALHKNLNHKNIVKLHGFFIESNHVNIILDYIPNGNLFTFVRHERQTPLSTVDPSNAVSIDVHHNSKHNTLSSLEEHHPQGHKA